MSRAPRTTLDPDDVFGCVIGGLRKECRTDSLPGAAAPVWRRGSGVPVQPVRFFQVALRTELIGTCSGTYWSHCGWWQGPATQRGT